MGTVIDTVGGAAPSGTQALGPALGEDQRPRAESTGPLQRAANADRGTGGESLADFLGYFSLGLGLAEVLAPNVMSRVIGVKKPDAGNRATMRLMGLREISAGVAILTNQQPAKSMWSRVAGDALDLALLGKTLANPENDRGRTIFAIGNVLAVSALDVMCAQLLSKQPATLANAGARDGIIRTKRSVTVVRPIEEVYAFWHDFENLPRFMRHLETVHATGDGRSHWVAKAPAGQTVEWDAETTEDRPNELIAWRSTGAADVQNAGRVEFRPAPAGRGTEVRVTLEYDPPFGKLGSKIAMLFREEPGQQVQDDLRHLKQVMEIGEIVVSDASKQRGPHAAQPDGRGVQL